MQGHQLKTTINICDGVVSITTGNLVARPFNNSNVERFDVTELKESKRQDIYKNPTKDKLKNLKQLGGFGYNKIKN